MPKQKKKPRLEHIVCKPCWELKYCPYGPLVEFFPLPSYDDDHDADEVPNIRKSYASWIRAVRNGVLKTKQEIYEAIERILCLNPDRWQ
jgi:hypothetical protein